MTVATPRNSSFRIHADASLLPAGVPHVPLLTPFWGRVDPPQSPERHRFDRWMALGATTMELTSLDAADVAVLPMGWEHVHDNPLRIASAKRFAERARAAGKRTLVFADWDSALPIPLEHSVVYRTSLYRSTQRPNEFAMPGWSGDLEQRYRPGGVSMREWIDEPTVGFRGQVPCRPRSLQRELLISLQHVLHIENGELHGWRARRRCMQSRRVAVQSLAASRLVKTRIELLPQFLGGALDAAGNLDWQVLDDARRAFVDVLTHSDYGLCVRGGGNFSYRLYETLCVGSIPLFVDTDCVLPCGDVIDWRGHCAWVDFLDVHRIDEKLRDFHRALSPSDFADRQRASRMLWTTYLAPEAFFSRLADVLR